MSAFVGLRLRPCNVIIATIALACSLPAPGAETTAPPLDDDLDVTMQVIADPNAKLPEDVIRRIPLPPRKADAARAAAASERAQSSAPASGDQKRDREAQELAREVSERAQERTQDAAEQREQASRSMADERRRDRDPPRTPPDSPRTPR
jgi:hypothetical protein